ncbi:MAG: TatD family hydrolase [Defluviitaleaceae bacterium]|nr:TatD family hydrolase [Defluviitaleaceae bacterium]
MNTIFETHAHYDHKQYDGDRAELLTSLPSCGVGAVLNVGCSMEASRASVALAERYPHVYATVGVHPHDAKTLTERAMDELRLLAQHDKVVAFGEIGLDFNRNFSPPEVQRRWLLRQLELAHDCALPVVIHSRDADEEAFAIIEASPHRRGVIHAFPGDVALAERYISLGFFLGIGGILTYDKTGRLRAVVEAMPLDKLLLETDCPYLTPVPHRGKRNESVYLSFVVDAIAAIKNTSAEAVRMQTWQNACTLFGITI